MQETRIWERLASLDLELDNPATGVRDWSPLAREWFQRMHAQLALLDREGDLLKYPEGSEVMYRAARGLGDLADLLKSEYAPEDGRLILSESCDIAQDIFRVLSEKFRPVADDCSIYAWRIAGRIRGMIAEKRFAKAS